MTTSFASGCLCFIQRFAKYYARRVCTVSAIVKGMQINITLINSSILIDAFRTKPPNFCRNYNERSISGFTIPLKVISHDAA